jgi:hypothetical protein
MRKWRSKHESKMSEARPRLRSGENDNNKNDNGNNDNKTTHSIATHKYMKMRNLTTESLAGCCWATSAIMTTIMIKQ